jgi:hypothetical protein
MPRVKWARSKYYLHSEPFLSLWGALVAITDLVPR